MVRNNSQLNNSQSQALAENNSTFNIQNSTLRTAPNSTFNIALCALRFALCALELRHGTARGARHNQFNHSQHIECYTFPVDLHTRSL